MGLVYGHPTDTRGWASILAAASTTTCTARSLDPLVPKRAVTNGSGRRARAQSRSKCTRIGPRAVHREHAPDWLLDGGRSASSTEVAMGRLSATRTPLRSLMPATGSHARSPCRGGPRLDSGTTPARPPGSIFQRRRAPEDHGRGRRGRRDAVLPQRASPSCSTMGTLSSSTSGMSGALVNGRQQQASAEAAKRSTLLSA